jgi:protein-disulfide isomerase
MTSDLAVQFGIPLAGWGLVHFLMVAAALAILWAAGDAIRTEATLLAFLLCTVATVAGSVLTIKMLGTETPFCPLCALVHGVNLLLLPVIILGSGQSPAELCGAIAAGRTNIVSGKVGDRANVSLNAIGLVTVALVGVVGFQWVTIQTDRRVAQAAAPATFEQVLSEYQATPEADIPLGDDDPWRGDPNAKLQLVIFSDFQCPACRQFADRVAELNERWPELAVIFKHFPLASVCNSKAVSNLHPLSCDVAYAAEAARQQGKFWELHDALFASGDDLSAETIAKVAENVGCDMDCWKNDTATATTKAKVDADVALGIELNVSGTPTAWLNGRPIPNGGMRYLDQLIEHLAGHEP